MDAFEDPVKKIVSKGKYAQVQGMRAGTIRHSEPRKAQITRKGN